jgi:hypothetical protein
MIMKRKGERGYPWRIPLDEEKGRDGTPLIIIENKAEEVSMRIHLTQY